MRPLLLLVCILFLLGCTSKDSKQLKIAASSVPHAELLQFIQNDMKEQGIDLKIIEIDDYNLPNRLLADGEVNANFFQHIPFLEQEIKSFGYPIEILAKIHIEPMGLYSKKIHKLEDLKESSIIAVPSDPTNEGRALLLLQKQGIITLKSKVSPLYTIQDIQDNPKKLKFIEVDAAMLPRSLSDVDLAAINTNYAMHAGLNPLKDALAIEAEDSPYVNVIAIRKNEEGREDLKVLKKLMTSEKMKEHILSKYKGSIIPAF